MSKRLEDMTLEELWALFPITLEPHNPKWTEWAMAEIERLRAVLSGFSPAISHIGSTAIPDIHAKPIIDILVEVSSEADRNVLKDILEKAGYICMSAAANRMSFNKGYTSAGYAEKVYHVHIRTCDDNDEISFRDYLISHPDAAREYERLKLSLLPEYEHNRDGYTEAKAEFVQRIMSLVNQTSYGGI